MSGKYQDIVKQLKEDYLGLVKNGMLLQQKGDIVAYKLNALRAEYIAQKLQSYNRAFGS